MRVALRVPMNDASETTEDEGRNHTLELVLVALFVLAFCAAKLPRLVQAFRDDPLVVSCIAIGAVAVCSLLEGSRTCKEPSG